jgi:alpha-ribazole phosphatase/probable phosphoglycerate mutase
VAIVTHGGVNRILLCEALGMPKESMFRVDQSYAAVSLIDYYQKTPVVRVVNVGRGLLDGGPGC